MSPLDATTDWTDGEPRMVVVECRSCGNHWYLPRNHCPVCGGAETTAAETVGTGLCVGVTRLHATADGAEPLALCLVELDEGPTVMAHVHDDALQPGDRARLTFLGTPVVPSFAREGNP